MGILTIVFEVSGVFADESAGSIDREAVEMPKVMDAYRAEVEEQVSFDIRQRFQSKIECLVWHLERSSRVE